MQDEDGSTSGERTEAAAKPRGLGRRRALVRRWTVLSLVAVAALTAALIAATWRSATDVPAAGADLEGLTSVLSRGVAREDVPLRFEDVTERLGIDFRHFPLARESLLPEDMGSGVACGDFDDDGFTDVFLVNIAGTAVPGSALEEERGASRLYRNVGGERFEDVTAESGIRFVGLGNGAAWGDFDGDGDLDLYVAAYGPNALFENRGDGTFADVTATRGVQDTRFSAGVSWGDYDRDGDLDLYVCNYVAFVYRESDRQLSERTYETEQPYTLNPSSYPAAPNALFRNRGDGTFEDVARAAGVDDPEGRSLSAAWTDLDGDGWLDLYVANDISRNGVFRRRGDGTFEDIGASSLAADYRGAMGIAIGDFDDDLDQDLVITHWIAQENALYLNMLRNPSAPGGVDGRLWFVDAADDYGLGQSSLDMIGWATAFCDLDNDGARDLWVVNGSTFESPSDHRRLVPQRPLLYWNRGAGDFVDVVAHASAELARPIVGRGGAQIDIDRDGRVDLVVLEHGGRARVFRNVSERTGHWLRVALRQPTGNTRALGARVYVIAAGRTVMAELGASSSYLSQDELTLHFGLGTATRAESVRIVWPDGSEETREGLDADREHVITRGK